MNAKQATLAAISVLNNRELSKLAAELLSDKVTQAVAQRKDVTSDSEFADLERIIKGEEDYFVIQESKLETILNFTDGKTVLEVDAE